MKPRASLEEKLAWMRARQAKREACEQVGAPPPERQISLERAQQKREIASERLEVIRVPEVARILKASPRTVRRWFEGRVAVVGSRRSTPGRRRYRIFLITKQDLYDFMEEKRAC